MATGEPVLLGISSITEANILKGRLAERGVELVFRHNAQTCASGSCGMQVEVWANEGDIPAIQEHFASERTKRFAGLDVNPELLNQVFDPDKEQAVCPACGSSFSTNKTECPDCGLSFDGLR